MESNGKRIAGEGAVLILKLKKIEWWLLKYSDTQKNSYNFTSSLEVGSISRLPPNTKITDLDFFLDLYEALDIFFQFHKNEEYFEEQMGLYQNIKYSNDDVADWIAQNEDMGANHYACFLLDYLDYDEDDKVNHLNIPVLSVKELNIFVDRMDFIFTIEFV